MDNSLSIEEQRQDIADILNCYIKMEQIKQRQCEEQIEINKEKQDKPVKATRPLLIPYILKQIFNIFLSSKDLGEYADYQSYKQYAKSHGESSDSDPTLERQELLAAYRDEVENMNQKISTYNSVIQAVNSSEDIALKTWQAAYSAKDDPKTLSIANSIVAASGVKPTYINGSGSHAYSTTEITSEFQEIYDKLRKKLSSLGLKN